MTITEPFEVVGSVCEQTGPLGSYAKITVRVDPARSPEFVNAAKVAGFEQRFAEAAFDGIRSISQKYSWLAFRFTIKDVTVQPVDSTEDAFRKAGVEAARAIFNEIYKELTVIAKIPKTKIFVVDTEGNLVQSEVGRMETSLLQGDYDVFFGDAQTGTRIHLQGDMVLLEGQ